MTHPPTPLPDTEPSISPEPPRRQRLVLPVLLSAALMTLAFPPADMGFLAWFGLAPLIYALTRAQRPRHAFGLGYLFGYAHWGATVIWIGTTVSEWTHSPIGWVAWVLLVAIMSCWFGLFGFSAWWIAKRSTGVRRVVAIAAAWTIMEWLRCQTGVAMPWSLVCYTQYRYLPVIQAAELGGIFVITLALGLMNAGLAEAWRMAPSHPTPLPSGRQKGDVLPVARSGRGGRGVRVLAPGIVAFALLLAYGFVALGRRYDGTPFRLALMQPNERSMREEVPKTPEQEVADSLPRLARLSDRAAAAHADLVIWPESAVPYSPVADVDIREAVSRAARQTHAWTLLGSGHEDPQKRSYNSAFLFDQNGAYTDRYDKTWLVPFGEWVPLRAILPFDSVFHFPRDITAGASDAVISAGPARMSVLICYESVFPVISRTRVDRGANLLVSITNDSWAGESSELQQHIAMAAFRAVETRRYLAASATTGVTALIDPTGRIRTIPPYREDLLVAEARLRDGKTPYVRWGDWLVSLCAAWVVFAFLPLRGQEHQRIP